MSNEKQEKIADIVKEMRTLGSLDEKSTDKIPRTLQALGLRTYADRIEAAHQREVAELTAIINAECRKCGECAKFGKDCTAGDVDGAEDNRACEKFVSREVAELRACLKMAVVNARIARTCYAFGRECDNCGQACDARKWNKVIEATKGASND